MGSLVEIAGWLGLSGVIGALTALMTAGKRFAGHLSEFAATIDAVLKDPRRADLAALAAKARELEADVKSVTGLLRRLFKS